MIITKERPIMFTAENVRSILAGTKTMTRRVLKQQPDDCMWPITNPIAGSTDAGFVFEGSGKSREELWVRCPYYVGDPLWVREAWRVAAWRENSGKMRVDYKASPELTTTPWLYPSADEFEKLWQQSTDDCEKSETPVDGDGQYHLNHGESPCRWRSPLFMTRWASRITLEVTGVKHERVQDISEADALAEGNMEWWKSLSPNDQVERYTGGHGPVEAFRETWDSIHGPEAWGDNPWVWAITFRRVER